MTLDEENKDTAEILLRDCHNFETLHAFGKDKQGRIFGLGNNISLDEFLVQAKEFINLVENGHGGKLNPYGYLSDDDTQAS